MPFVEAIARAAYARHVASMGREPAPMVADFAAAERSGTLHVAIHEGAVAGYIVFAALDGAIFIDNVAVLPALQGRGIGRALLELAEAVAHEKALPCLRLYTNAAMLENLSLYGRTGWRRTDERVEDGFHRIYFEKSV